MDYMGYPGWLVRLLQRWHLRVTRLGRMLQRRGVDRFGYLRAFPIVEIESQLARCHACQLTRLCDRVLGARHVAGHTRYTFCPNARFIDGHVLQRRAR